MTITCSVCGTINPEGTQYCEGCGVELAAAPAQSAPQASDQAPAAPVLSAPEGAGTSPVDQIQIGGATADTASSGSPVIDGDITPPAEVIPGEGTPVADLNAGMPDMPLPETGTAATDAPQAATPAAPMDTAGADAMPMQESVTPEASAPASSDTTAAAAPVAAAPVSPAPADASVGAAKLGIKKYGAATGEFIPLQGERLVVGRFDASSGPVDIDLSGLGGQEHISRRHAELYRENGAWMVRDLGSTNGVYVKRAGEAAFSPRLQEPTRLSNGDEVAFGNLMLSFHQD
ncbi:FHA domain-containing protein [Deinococcus koreensis]|uniref:FraH-like protein n=1 Tax=Deinococcus koreensis TaxID=2054903 RepID=A0A2K3UXY2_9DEIO|nr:FHA domain-containing protein [Deinococcus koreensis]PNY81384.1 FraH-like protein [Deinococcus koreensis]